MSKNFSHPLKKVGNFKEIYEAPKEATLKYYTPEQFKKYISFAESTILAPEDWGYYVFFSIAFYTGMRKGEINALKWSDIENDIIHVRRSITQKIKGGGYRSTPKK